MKTTDRILLIAFLGYSIILMLAILVPNLEMLITTPIKLSLVVIVIIIAIYYLVKSLLKLKK